MGLKGKGRVVAVLGSTGTNASANEKGLWPDFLAGSAARVFGLYNKRFGPPVSRLDSQRGSCQSAFAMSWLGVLQRDEATARAKPIS
jgi:hypothetical protein